MKKNLWICWTSLPICEFRFNNKVTILNELELIQNIRSLPRL